MKVSIIIATYNKLTRLKLVLCSLENQCIKADLFELIIVDDGSNDGSQEFLESYHPEFRYKYIRCNRKGRAFARNKGAKAAKNDILLFLDDDTVPSADMVYQHMCMQMAEPRIIHGKIMENPYVKFFEDPVRGIFYTNLGKNVGNADGLLEKCVTYSDVKSGSNLLEKNSKISSYEKIVKCASHNLYHRWDWILFSGGNTSIPKQWFESVNGFDEIYDIYWGCEDLDLGYRLMKEGYAFAYSDDAKVYHLDHYRIEYIKEHRRNFEIFIKKYNDRTIDLFGLYVENKTSAKEIMSIIEKKNIEEG